MTFDFYDFSKYRTQLMGISMLLIMLFHVEALPLGYVGVEFFLLISGIGLYFSLSKNNDLKTFYKKRLFRILPTYLIIAIPYFYYIRRTEFSLGEYFLNLTGLGIINHELSYWFIIQILLCYLIAPFYFKILKYKYSIIIPFVVLVVFFTIGYYYRPIEIMLNRFAIFLLGMHFAALVYYKKQIKSPLIVPICILAPILIFVVENLHILVGLKRVIFFFLTIPTLMFFIMLIKRCPSFIDKALVFVGGITLEIYMLHEHICFALPEEYLGYTAGAILSFPICFVAAYFFNRLINYLTARLLPK